MKKQLQKCLLITSAILFSSMISNAQWVQVGRVYGGTIANDGAVSFSIGTKGYVVAGSSTNNMYVYDTLANSWSLVGSIPDAAGHAFAMGFAINGKGYVVGGDTSGIPVNTVWEFDPVAVNHWTQKHDFPAGARDAGFAFALNNYAYVGAGNDNVNLYNDIWKYDPVLDSWTQLSQSVPETGLIFPTSFAIGNKGYILTGGIPPFGVSEITDMWCLDGADDSLRVKANFGGAGRQAAFAFSNGSFGYVGGGQSNYTANYSDMWMYDPVNDVWSVSISTPMFGAAWSSTFAIGDAGYAGIGAKFVGANLQGDDQFYRFRMDVTTGIKNVTDNKLSYTLYPDPASDNFHISGNIHSSAHVLINDVEGRTVIEETIPESKTISVGTLSPGLYTIFIKDGDNLTRGKFLKN